MKKLFINCSKSSWTSGVALAKALGGKVIRYRKSKYRYRPNKHIILNYGAGPIDTNYIGVEESDEIQPQRYLAYATNKLMTMERLQTEIPNNIPAWTTNQNVAVEWAETGHVVYCRRTVTGSKGAGIVIAKVGGDIVPAPLYTKSVGKCREYRVHVMGDDVIHVAQKKRRNGNEGDGLIKNLENGWVFTTQNMTPWPEDMFNICRKALALCFLDFGAVDVAVREGGCYVLEINTAPGLQGVTLEKYTAAFKKILEGM